MMSDILRVQEFQLQESPTVGRHGWLQPFHEKVFHLVLLTQAG